MKRNIYLIAFIASITSIAVISSCKKDIKGCTDHLAKNYNVDATVDDGSCVYEKEEEIVIEKDTVWGCMDSTADNYNPDATHDDSSCVWVGCMDPKADNYDPKATVDDGSCIDPRIKFAGLFSSSNDCSFPFVPNPNPEIIYDSTVVDTLFITPFFDLAGGTAYAFVDSTSVTVPQQTLLLIDFSGSGSINGTNDVVTIFYNWDAGILGSGTCTAVYNKQ